MEHLNSKGGRQLLIRPSSTERMKHDRLLIFYGEICCDDTLIALPRRQATLITLHDTTLTAYSVQLLSCMEHHKTLSTTITPPPPRFYELARGAIELQLCHWPGLLRLGLTLVTLSPRF